MIDIHSHILPFLDDGAKSEEQAMIMLEIAKSEGMSPEDIAERLGLNIENI